jgi:hypothetical protein
MGFPFVEKYLPISQKEVVDGSQDLEEGSRSSSSEFDSRKKAFSFGTKLSFWSRFKQWLPWLLCLCLLTLNIRSSMKLKSLVFEDAVYCKVAVYKQRRVELLTNPTQRRSTSPRMDGKT